MVKTKRSFGFVVSADGEFEDVYVSGWNMNGAMHGDTVEATFEGEIVKILDRANKVIVGTFDRGYVTAGDRRIDEEILIGKKESKGAQNGDTVAAQIVKYPCTGQKAEGRVIEIVCRAGEPGGDIKALMRRHGVRDVFPKKVITESEKASKKACDLSDREDLRGKTTFTIDGADAKDLDDAVSIEKNEAGNFILGVHIADVSFYVEEGSAIDREALLRGTSIYLLNQVTPMLPEALSNGVCSLDKGMDRLTLSLDIEISGNGEIKGCRIYKGVIRSRERMVYTDVSDILEYKDLNLIEKYANIYGDLLLMEELAAVLRKKRDLKGSLDFELDEAMISLDGYGAVESVCTAERRTANKMIEEFMLAANEAVAERFFGAQIPFIYRVHEKPAPEKLEEFKEFIKYFGLNLKSTKVLHPGELNKLLKQIEGEPYEKIVNTFLLRSMQKAFYSTDCGGHFGLGLKRYCHFTAPIRRYPDLMIHRLIKECLGGGIDGKRRVSLEGKTAFAAEASSRAERKALELEREAEKMKKAEYMSYHIGEKYEGVVSGVKSFGVFVELENTVEGLAPEQFLPPFDFYPGDRVIVEVLSADPAEGQIDFMICEHCNKNKEYTKCKRNYQRS